MTARAITVLLVTGACWLAALGAWYAAAGLAGTAIAITAIRSAR